MTTNDPITDMLTRICNVNTAKHDVVGVPTFKVKVAIADILVGENYVEKYELVENKGSQDIRITLRYGATEDDHILSGPKRISKPDFRIHAGKEDMPKILGGLSTAVISTNQGVIIGREARHLGTGGEVLAFIW